MSTPLDDFFAEANALNAPPENKGVVDTVWDWGLSALDLSDTVLDAAARPVRTFLGTGDIGRSFESIVDKEQALSPGDLRRAYGIGDIGENDGQFDIGDIADFAMDLGVGIVTDPLTYTGIGLLTKGGAAVKSIGRQAVGDFATAASKGDDLLQAANRASDYFNTNILAQEAKLGQKIHARAPVRAAFESDDAFVEATQKFLGGKFGMGETFIERVARGEQSLFGFGLPFRTEVSYDLLSGSGTARALEFANRPFEVMAKASELTPATRGVTDAIRWTRDFFFNPDINDSFGELTRIAGKRHAQEVHNLRIRTQKLDQRIHKTGFSVEEKADLLEITELTGINSDTARNTVRTLREKLGKKYKAEDIDAIVAEAGEIDRATFELMKKNNPEIQALGEAENARLESIREKLGDKEAELAKLEARRLESLRTFDEFKKAKEDLSKLEEGTKAAGRVVKDQKKEIVEFNKQIRHDNALIEYSNEAAVHNWKLRVRDWEAEVQKIRQQPFVGEGQVIDTPPKPTYPKLREKKSTKKFPEKPIHEKTQSEVLAKDIKEMEKAGFEVGPGDVDLLKASHRESIQNAIIDGVPVPPKVIKDYPELKAQWMYSRTPARLIEDAKSHVSRKRRAWESARGKNLAYDLQQNKKEVLRLKKEFEEAQRLVDSIPNHMQHVLTIDAIQMLPKGKVNDAMIKRAFEAEGVPLTARHINKMIRENPEKVIATAGQEVIPGAKAFDIIREMAKGKNTDAIVQELKKKGGLFEEDITIALAANIDQAARKATKGDFIDGVKNLWGKEALPDSGVLTKTIRDLEKKIDMAPDARSKVDLQNKLQEAQEQLSESVKNKLRELNARDGGGWRHAGDLDPRLSGTVIRNEVYDRVQKHIQNSVDIEWTKGAMRYASAYNKIYKFGALSWPGSWVRDWIGNIQLRMQHDGFDLATSSEMEKLFKVAMRADKEAGALKGMKLNLGEFGEIGGEEFLTLARTQGLMDADIVANELGTVVNSVAKKEGKVVKGLRKVFHKAYEPHRFLNSMERVQMFAARLAKGDTPAEAAARVDSALYNYSRVSPGVELLRNSGAMPFATWASKNIPVQLETLFTRPGQFTSMLHAKQAIEDGVPGVSDAELPKWVSDRYPVVLSKDADGNFTFVTANGIIPLADLPQVSDPLNFLMEMSGPLVKFPLERIFNRDSFFKSDIEKFDGEIGLLRVPGLDPIQMRKKNIHAARTFLGRPFSIMQSSAKLLEEDSPGAFDTPALTTAAFGLTARTADQKRIKFFKAKEINEILSQIKYNIKKLEESGRQPDDSLYQKQRELEKLKRSIVK